MRALATRLALAQKLSFEGSYQNWRRARKAPVLDRASNVWFTINDRLFEWAYALIVGAL